MQNRNDEPRLQHAPLRLPRKDGGRGRVNRRAMGVGRVSEWRKVTSQKPGGNFRQPQSEAEDRTIWPCRDHERRSSSIGGYFSRCPIANVREGVAQLFQETIMYRMMRMKKGANQGASPVCIRYSNRYLSTGRVDYAQFQQRLDQCLPGFVESVVGLIRPVG